MDEDVRILRTIVLKSGDLRIFCCPIFSLIINGPYKLNIRVHVHMSKASDY